MYKKILSTVLAAMMLFSCVPAMYAADGEVTATITLSEEYPVMGDIINVTSTVTSTEALTADVKLTYGESEILAEAIDLQEDPFTYEKASEITIADALTIKLSVIKDEQEIAAAEKTIEQKAILELSEVKAEYKDTAEDTLNYTVSAKITNIGNLDAENLILAYGETKTEAFSLDAKAEVVKELPVAIAKADLTGEKKDGRLSLAFGEADPIEEDISFANPYFVSKITIEGGEEITLAKDETTALTVTLEPETTLSVPEISVDNTEIISLSEDKKTITALKEGEAEITVKAGDKEEKIAVTVLRSRNTYEPESIRFYYMNEEEKVYLNPESSFIYTTSSYTISLPENLKNFSLYYEITGTEAIPEIGVLRDGRDEFSNIGKNEDGSLSWSSSYIDLRFKFYDTEDDEKSASYTFTLGHPIELEEIPEEIEVYSDFDEDSDIDFEFTLPINDYASDPNDIYKFYVLDENGKQIGKYTTDGEKDAKIRYWVFGVDKSIEEGTTMDVTFVFVDENGIKATAETTLVYAVDEEDPDFDNNMNISISESTTTATVKWSHATDNDKIDHYVVSYYKSSSSSSNAKTETVKYYDDEKPSVSLSSLSADTTYKLFITAYDRSGNSCKSSNKSFTTEKRSSSSGSSSGSSGSSSSSSVFRPNTVINNNTASNNSNTSSNTASGTKTFTDIESYTWAKKEIEELTAKGIISGISDTEYGPAMSIRRCDFILLLCRAYGFNGTFTDNFSDVPADAYYAQAVGLAKQLGIVNGMGDNEFNPNGFITRQDMCVMALRAMNVAGVKLEASMDISAFNDNMDIASYAIEAFATLNKAGIITGDENGNANPRKNTTRAEAAVIIYRILNI